MATSLPLATAAAVATILAAGPASAAPVDQPNAPTTPAQPADDGQQPQGNTQPGVTTPGQPGGTNPGPEGGNSPSQPGVTTPNQPGGTTPNQPSKPDDNLTAPTQPGVTTPRVAPLPVPGQNDQAQQPAGTSDQNNQGGQSDQLKPQQQSSPDQNAVTPSKPQPQDSQMGTLHGQQQGGSGTAEQSHWNSPTMDAAPAAPVVKMQGPHTEFGANVDGGSLAPGYVANTHHFNNAHGYVGTMGYTTPTGLGDAGVSVEYVQANRVKVTTYTHNAGLGQVQKIAHATGLDDKKAEYNIDTTAPNAAKAAVEGWIKMQPGGQSAIDAAARVGRIPQGGIAPQQAKVAGVTTQWGGANQY
ncbi:MAG: hypothetical protein J2P18_05600 [Nocardia sp.]|nr:hypothetical protein [Nocardia sp.]